MQEDFGSDGFNQYEAEFDSDPTVSLNSAVESDALAEGNPEEGAVPLEARELLLDMKQKEINKASENMAVRDGMEGYWNQQMKLNGVRYLAQGYSPEQAARLAQDLTEREVEVGAQDILRRRVATELVSRETGVNPELFKDLWDERAMRQRVNEIRQIGSPEAQQAFQAWSQLQRARNQVQQQGVPYQNFNRPSRTNGGNSPARLRQQYADGLIGLTPAVQKAING